MIYYKFLTFSLEIYAYYGKIRATALCLKFQKGMNALNDFTYQNKTKIVFGKNSENQLPQLIKKYGSKILLVYGGESIKEIGLYAKVTAMLNENQIEYFELSGIVPNPRLRKVYEGIDICRQQNIEFILAVGGGSVIDTAKAVALGFSYEGDVWDFFENRNEPEACLPVGVVLTIPAAGSESSKNLVITKEDGLLKRGYGSEKLRPQFAIMNPETTYSLPFYQTACGISDMLAHIMERYFTKTEHVDVSDRLCEGLMRAIISNAKLVKQDPENYDARAEIMWAGTLAHSGLIGMGREEDWGSHAIEHELSAIYDIAHGAGLSIIFPAWMKHVYRENEERFVQFAQRVMNVELPNSMVYETIMEGISRLECFYTSLGIPTRLSAVGIDSSHLEEMAKKANSCGNFKKLDASDIYKIYKLALD